MTCFFIIKVNLQNKNGYSALHRAASSGHADITSLLIDASAQVDLRDNEGSTPLHYAALSGQTDVISLLIDANCDVFSQDYNGNTPFDVADESVRALFH